MKLLLLNLMLVSIIIGCKDSKTAENHPLTDENLNVAKKITNEPETAKSTQNNQDDWYWKNTIMSNNNIFENWQEGPVKLVMTYRMKQNDTKPRTVTVGSIDAAGNIMINLPSDLKTETRLDNLGNLVFYDLQDISKLEYENGKSGYFSNTTIQVEKNGATLGTLTMGNSVRTTYNLVNQSTLTLGDEGYLLYLAFVDDESSLKGSEIRNDKVRRDGTNTIEAETTVIYELDFNPGWNYIKTEVIGKYDLDHERGLNASWFKKHKHTVVPEMPKDAAYYFRKTAY